MTQIDIARSLGISQPTVGAVLGAHSPRSRIRLSEDTRQRILGAARKMGYRPHRYARIMRQGKTGMIAMLQFGSDVQAHKSRAFHAARAIHANGYHVLNHHIHWHVEGVQYALDAIIDARAEALLLIGPSELVPASFLQQIKEWGMPVVSMAGVRFDGIPQVRSDFRQGMRELTYHLLGRGHRKLTLAACWGSEIHDEAHCWPVLEKVAGIREAARNFGKDEVAFEVSYDEEPWESYSGFQLGRKAMRKILQRSPRPDAVLCTDDAWAIGALAACAEAGVRVPQDIAVTGFDNDEIGQFSHPPLTTMAQQTEEMAKKAVELLMRRVRGETLSANDELVKMPCQLVARQSCGAKQ